MFSFRANPRSYLHCHILFRCLNISWLQFFLWLWPLNPNICHHAAEDYRKPSSDLFSSLKTEPLWIKENLGFLGKFPKPQANNAWAATAIFYTEEFFFLEAGWCNLCFINIMFVCLHFQKSFYANSITTDAWQTKNFMVISVHLHVPSAAVLMEVCGNCIYWLGRIQRWLLGIMMGVVPIDSVFHAINSVFKMKTICTSRKREEIATLSADCLFFSLMDP